MGALSHFKFLNAAKARRTNVRFCQPLKLKNEPSVESPFLMIINLMTLVRTLGETDVKHVVFAKAHGAVRKRQSCARIPPGCCSWREEADQFQSAGPEKKPCQRAAAQMFARY